MVAASDDTAASQMARRFVSAGMIVALVLIVLASPVFIAAWWDSRHVR